MFFPPTLQDLCYGNGDAMLNGHGCIGKWMVERKWKWKWYCEMETEMETIKKRDEMAGKNGKVNEKSKWKNW